MPRKSDTRQRMVHATVRLIRRHGLHGTGLQQVLAESSAPRGSLYFHFPDGKQQLTVEAVRYAASRITARLKTIVEEGATPSETVRLLFDSYAAWVERTEFAEGCPIAGVALDLAPGWEQAQQACAEAAEEWTRVLAAAFESAGTAEADSQARAALVLSALEGALVLARAQRSAQPMRSAGAELARLLEAR